MRCNLNDLQATQYSSHKWTALSSDAEASVEPPAEDATLCVTYENGNMSAGLTTRTVLSDDPEATFNPSAEKATDQTQCIRREQYVCLARQLEIEHWSRGTAGQYLKGMRKHKSEAQAIRTAHCTHSESERQQE